jgi:DNA polymerase-3 subunit alpha (Gram-positive type)
MKRMKPLKEVFPAAMCSPAWDFMVTDVVLDKSTRKLVITMDGAVGLEAKRQLSEALRDAYSLSEVSITAENASERPAVSGLAQEREELLRAAAEKRKGAGGAKGKVLYGGSVKGKPVPMAGLNEDSGRVVVEGEVIAADHFTNKRGDTTLKFTLTDYTGSLDVVTYLRNGETAGLDAKIKPGLWFTVAGNMEVYQKTLEVQLRPESIMLGEKPKRLDTSESGKRVELHLHTQMSNMDATTNVAAAIALAAEWGHPAIAITDHGVVHAFPEALKEAKRQKKENGRDIKIIYGCEAYFARNGEADGGKESNHIILLAQNQTGLTNLYRLVSKAHTDHFYYRPNVYKSELDKHREGLVVGSACADGELFEAIVEGRSREDLLGIAAYYDYVEIQPLCNNAFLTRRHKIGEEDLRAYNRRVVSLAEELGKPFVAAGDVHFLNPEDEQFRKVLLAQKNLPDADSPLPLYLRTTDEMMAEFAYLGEETARRAVIENPAAIAAMCDTVQPVRSGEFFPTLPGSAEELRSLVESKAMALYGSDIPALIRERIDMELNAIIGKGFDVVYMIAQKLVAQSNADGYLVGSRGSVASSFAAFLAGITEVSALPPHYRCPKCLAVEFPENQRCGADLPRIPCTGCGAELERDGYDLPFFVFLGFDADKKPDIDLNFSGEYQAKAHQQTIDMLGVKNVYRAGTVSTVAEKTARGFAMKYLEDRKLPLAPGEIQRLAAGCEGVKRGTGQHPGGLVIVPHDYEIYDFCPVQYPADARDSGVVTTHFDYPAIEDNLIKVDILGHVDPTMIKHLERMTGVNALAIPLDEPDTLSLFSSPKILGWAKDPILGDTGACAIPEFGTKFVREMLRDTRPSCFDELIRISGLSHGTGVWLGNAKELIAAGKATLKSVITSREDMMASLLHWGMDRKLAFTIMESVRKGRGMNAEWKLAMASAGVPDWFAESCEKITYLFTRGHAAAYVIMAFRIAWFKVHHPLAFYSAYFSLRANAFDAAGMTRGLHVMLEKRDDLERKANKSATEEDMLNTFEVCYEFYKRGFSFAPVHIAASDAVFFTIRGKTLIPPFTALPGLGEVAAKDIADQREREPFLSAEEVYNRCPKISKAHMEALAAIGAFEGLPESSQESLF